MDVITDSFGMSPTEDGLPRLGDIATFSCFQDGSVELFLGDGGKVKENS